MSRKKVGVENKMVIIVIYEFRGWGIGLFFLIGMLKFVLKEVWFLECGRGYFILDRFFRNVVFFLGIEFRGVVVCLGRVVM